MRQVLRVDLLVSWDERIVAEVAHDISSISVKIESWKLLLVPHSEFMTTPAAFEMLRLEIDRFIRFGLSSIALATEYHRYPSTANAIFTSQLMTVKIPIRSFVNVRRAMDWLSPGVDEID